MSWIHKNNPTPTYIFSPGFSRFGFIARDSLSPGSQDINRKQFALIEVHGIIMTSPMFFVRFSCQGMNGLCDPDGGFYCFQQFPFFLCCKCSWNVVITIVYCSGGFFSLFLSFCIIKEVVCWRWCNFTHKKILWIRVCDFSFRLQWNGFIGNKKKL